MKFKNICVLGGSGFVGANIVRILASQGRKVRVLTRNRERAKGLIVLPTVEVIDADIHAPAQLKQYFGGMDAVINLAGILHEVRLGRVDKPAARRGDFQRVHVELPRKVVHACSETGIQRLLHMSALGASGTSSSAYQRSKGIGEALVREAGMPHSDNERWYLDGPKFVRGATLYTTIFRPSVIFGRGDHFLSMLARLARTFPLIPLANPNARFQPVWVEDVARAYVNALDDTGSFSQTYDVCGPNVYTLQQLMILAANTVNAHPRIVPLCDRLSYLQAWAMELLPGKKIMTRDNYYAMQVENVCKGEFPQPPAFQPAAPETVAPEYLDGDHPRGRYQAFRNRAGR